MTYFFVLSSELKPLSIYFNFLWLLNIHPQYDAKTKLNLLQILFLFSYLWISLYSPLKLDPLVLSSQRAVKLAKHQTNILGIESQMISVTPTQPPQFCHKSSCRSYVNKWILLYSNKIWFTKIISRLNLTNTL